MEIPFSNLQKKQLKIDSKQGFAVGNVLLDMHELSGKIELVNASLAT